jgi:PAS domain S-box-containing protein
VALLAADRGPAADRPLLVGLVALLIAAEHRFATRIVRGRRQGETTTHEEAYIVFLALVEPATAVLAAIVLGFALGNVLARRPWLKAVYNVASTAAAVALGMLAMLALGGGEERTAAAAGAAITGAVVYAVANRLLLSGVLAAVGAGRFDDVSSRLLLLGTNVALGVLAGLAAHESVWALPLALLALVVLHFTLAGHGRARAEQEKLRDVIDASSDGILVIDERGEVVSWSAACAEITGYDADEVCGRPLRHLRRLVEAEPYDDPHAVRGQRYAARIRRKDGDLRWLIVTRASLPEGGDLLVVHDDTVRRTLEEMRAAQFQEQTRSDLIASVSHEFRTPLTSILGFTETLLRRGWSTTCSTYARSAATRCSSSASGSTSSTSCGGRRPRSRPARSDEASTSSRASPW